METWLTKEGPSKKQFDLRDKRWRKKMADNHIILKSLQNRFEAIFGSPSIKVAFSRELNQVSQLLIDWREEYGKSLEARPKDDLECRVIFKDLKKTFDRLHGEFLQYPQICREN
ncbi:hypothetical protein MMC13_007081 [Lambiella insularis]|nr:hypothetical protein [Lambiella insularis]